MLEMDPDRPDPETGPWQGRVRFAAGGLFAYRPGQVMVKKEIADQAHEVLATWVSRLDEEVEPELEWEDVADSHVLFKGSFEVQAALEQLHGTGILGQVNHVLFATSCCPPHPADPCADQFYANPFYANPFYANPWGPCGCGCSGGANANPFYANPFYANPFYANAEPSPFANAATQHSGARRSSAKPSAAPKLGKKAPVQSPVRIAILDTGWAAQDPPKGLPKINVSGKGGDAPDEDGDGFLDPAAGHGTFIAGVIEQLVPGCELEVIEVLGTYGDGDEAVISNCLQTLAQLPDEKRPHLINLSFGGYSPLGMGALATAIQALHDQGTVVVASAGNDATCFPMYPAALPHVVGVAATDQDGKAASFTNYGPWVRASALGVNVVSLFFDGFNGAEPPQGKHDPDHFQGWALWSGTSFSAPRVVAALAKQVGAGKTPRQAVKQLIDNEKLPRHPALGTEVDPTK